MVKETKQGQLLTTKAARTARQSAKTRQDGKETRDYENRPEGQQHQLF